MKAKRALQSGDGHVSSPTRGQPYSNVCSRDYQPCFCNDLLRAQEKENFSDPQASYISGSLLEAGSDTTASTLYGFIQALLVWPEVLRKAQEEVDRVIGPDRLPAIEDYENLPYIRSCIKESIRWMPTVILGVPHAAIKEDSYMGYVIPAGATMINNVWYVSNFSASSTTHYSPVTGQFTWIPNDHQIRVNSIPTALPTITPLCISPPWATSRSETISSSARAADSVKAFTLPRDHCSLPSRVLSGDSTFRPPWGQMASQSLMMWMIWWVASRSSHDIIHVRSNVEVLIKLRSYVKWLKRIRLCLILRQDSGNRHLREWHSALGCPRRLMPEH